MPPESGRSDVTTFPFAAPSEPVAKRIRAEAVETCQAWVQLGRRHFEIFGIVTAEVIRIDELVRRAMKRHAAERQGDQRGPK